MKKLLIAALLLTSGTAAFAAQDSTLISFKIVERSRDNGEILQEVTPTLQYDFDAQYPYYLVEGRKWEGGELIQAQFSKIPDSGYLYVISMDSKNNVRGFSQIDLKTRRDVDSAMMRHYFPAKDSALVADNLDMSDACICFWYAPEAPVEPFDRLTQGLRLTTGSLIRRMLGQVGRRLMLPSTDWHLVADEYGVTNSTVKNFVTDRNRVLPIFIRFSNNSGDLGRGRKPAKKGK